MPGRERRKRALWTGMLAWGLAASAICPAAARAGNNMGLEVGPVESVAGAICVSYEVEEPFTPRLAETLQSGMPATVTFEVLWFDKLVLAIRSEHKVVYDDWAQAFRIRSGVNPPRSRKVRNLDSLATFLFRARRLPIAEAAALDSTSTYYVSVRVTIRPVATEDLGEIEDWLSGEDSKGEGARGLPRYLLGLAVSLSGLGDRTALEKSERFVPARLGFPARPG
jgi:hypothetical protein